MHAHTYICAYMHTYVCTYMYDSCSLLLVLFCLGLISVVLSSLETRYEFSSTQLGVITSSYDVTILLTVIFISYFGGNSHKPIWLGAGMAILALGSLVFALPQFVGEEYDLGKIGYLGFEACKDVDDFSPDCNERSSNLLFFFVFILGNVLIGIGAAPLFTVGTSYIDDIFFPKYTPICLGFYFTAAVVGPALGFGLGGVFLKVYVDPWEDTTLIESDPRWVGAWWLGFIVCGMISILISSLFFMFPEKYPNSDDIQKERAKLASVQNNRTFKIKELPKHILDLLASMPFVLVTLASSLQALTVSGIVSFAPKYIEAQFGLTTSVGGLVSGAVGVPSTGLGIILGMRHTIDCNSLQYIQDLHTFVGAVLVYCVKPTPKRLSLCFAILNVIATVFLVTFLLRCPTHEIAGITVSYPNRYS